MQEQTQARRSGWMAWMANNRVAANLVMAVLLFGGAIFARNIKQEVFPEFALDVIDISVAYPGASPEEVERGVTQTIEEAVRGIDGVKTVTSTSGEGFARLTLELALDADRDRAQSAVKAAVDRITSFPADVERPVVALAELKSTVISLVLYGKTSEHALRGLAEQARDQLLADPRISQAELAGVRPLEISVEVSRDRLRAHGLTLDRVAAAIRGANVEVPAGGIKTGSGEILVRTHERRDLGREFANIVISSQPDGSELFLGDIAHIDDGFRETDERTFFNGQPAVMVQVYRVGEQTPTAVSDATHEWIATHGEALPPGIAVAVWNDRSEMYQQRIELLTGNALQGLALVLFCLGLFLEIRLAFWVAMGIPTSMLGAFIFLPGWNVSLNMISLFAFIITVGVVVDDAIVVSEAVHNKRQEGLSPIDAAVAGVKEVAAPVAFSVLTTVVAFAPLLFVPGTMGQFFRNIPLVVITVLLISLVESLFVLPAHLAHDNPLAGGVRRVLASVLGPNLSVFGWIARKQRAFSERFERWVATSFHRAVEAVVDNRGVTLAVAFSCLVVCFGFLAGGRIAFTFFPKIESDVVFAQLRMPYGTPAKETEKHLHQLVAAAQEVLRESGGEQQNSRGIFSQLGVATFGGMARSSGEEGGHVAEVAVLMRPMGERKLGSAELARRWRAAVGELTGADSLKFTFSTGASNEAPIGIQLSHGDARVLEAAGAELAAKLRGYTGVKDVDDGVSLGKHQVDLTITPEARSMGITEADLGRQVRAAFFGAEAARQQRGRHELRVYVRLPDNERASVFDIESLVVQSPAGGEIPLSQAAEVSWRRAYTTIQREDGRRVLSVTADVEEGRANANAVMADLRAEILPRLQHAHPGLQLGLAGQQRRQAESLGALAIGFPIALVIMFALMAIPLRSYRQPLLIMLDIPFGMVGALIGHLVMGYDLSLLSAMGLVALSGVVVNDSIVLVDAIHTYLAEGMSQRDAVIAACVRRFRPILLTSLTTFLGLAPLIFERDMQARFLVPMALSLGFGVLFSTLVTLFVVPCLHLAMEDVASRLPRAAPAAASAT